jgi:hypothetical protein
MASNKAIASFVLLDCTADQMQREIGMTFADRRPFAFRFLHTIFTEGFCPPAIACAIASSPKVLLTAISVTDDASRLASRHAAAISSFTFASPAEIVARHNHRVPFEIASLEHDPKVDVLWKVMPKKSA